MNPIELGFTQRKSSAVDGLLLRGSDETANRSGIPGKGHAVWINMRSVRAQPRADRLG